MKLWRGVSISPQHFDTEVDVVCACVRVCVFVCARVYVCVCFILGSSTFNEQRHVNPTKRPALQLHGWQAQP